MKLILENWRGYLAEDEKDEMVALMDQAFAHLVKDLEKVEPAESEEEINEVGGVVVAGAVLAAPQILEIIGETINWLVPKMRRLVVPSEFMQAAAGGDPSRKTPDSTAFGNKLIEISEWLHHKYTAPLEFVIKRIFPEKDEEWIHKWASRVFHAIVAAFLLASGTGAIKAFKAAMAKKAMSQVAWGTLEAALAAVKSDELREFLFGAATAGH
jgi:hypothetical protein